MDGEYRNNLLLKPHKMRIFKALRGVEMGGLPPICHPFSGKRPTNIKRGLNSTERLLSNMDIAKRITELREEAGENRKEFAAHTGIPVRTLEDWEAGRRIPPEYIPRLIEYQMKYEKLIEEKEVKQAKINQ